MTSSPDSSPSDRFPRTLADEFVSGAGGIGTYADLLTSQWRSAILASVVPAVDLSKLEGILSPANVYRDLAGSMVSAGLFDYAGSVVAQSVNLDRLLASFLPRTTALDTVIRQATAGLPSAAGVAVHLPDLTTWDRPTAQRAYEDLRVAAAQVEADLDEAELDDDTAQLIQQVEDRIDSSGEPVVDAGSRLTGRQMFLVVLLFVWSSRSAPAEIDASIEAIMKWVTALTNLASG